MCNFGDAALKYTYSIQCINLDNNHGPKYVLDLLHHSFLGGFAKSQLEEVVIKVIFKPYPGWVKADNGPIFFFVRLVVG